MERTRFELVVNQGTDWRWTRQEIFMERQILVAPRISTCVSSAVAPRIRLPWRNEESFHRALYADWPVALEGDALWTKPRPGRKEPILDVTRPKLRCDLEHYSAAC